MTCRRLKVCEWRAWDPTPALCLCGKGRIFVELGAQCLGVIECGWRQLPRRKRDGLSNEGTLKSERWVDNTLDFILPLKLLFPLPPLRSIQTKEKRATLTSFLPRVPQEPHTGQASVGRAEVRPTLPRPSWAC